MNRAILLGGAAILAAGAGLAAALLTQSGESQCLDTRVAGADIGGPFTLVDQTGATVTEAVVITRPSLVYFGYAFCPDVCPVDNARNVAAVDLLAERGIDARPVFITVDPARDTPELLADYARNMGGDMIALTGTEAQVRAAANAYRVVYSRNGDDPDYYLMNHSAFTYLVLPGEGFVTFFRREATPAEIADRTACVLGED